MTDNVSTSLFFKEEVVKTEIKQEDFENLRAKMTGKVSVHGRVERTYPITNTEALADDGEIFTTYPNAKYTFTVPMKNGKFHTGLDPVEAFILGKLLELPEGVNLKASFENKYWRNFKLQITQRGLELDLSIPLHYLYYRILLVHPQILIEGNEDPERTGAQYLLVHKERRERKVSSEALSTAKAYAIFNAMSEADRLDYLYINGVDAATLSPDGVIGLIGEHCKENPKRLLDYDALGNKSISATVMKAVLRGVVLQKPGGMFYYGEKMMGKSLDEVSVFLTSAQNEDVLDAIRLRMK